MSTSNRYDELYNAIEKLRRDLLPDPFNPTGDYEGNSKIRTQTLAFELLSHAEVESYLEDRAMELFEEGWRAWENDSLATKVALGLLAFSGTIMKPPPSTKSLNINQDFYVSIKRPLQKSQSIWRLAHKNNHGIKEENVLALFLPLGIDVTALDETLLADLNSFGADRGKIAHSSTHRNVQGVDPKSSWDKVQNVLAGLRHLDQVIEVEVATVRKQMPSV